MNNIRFANLFAIVTPLALAIVLGMLCMGERNHRDMARKAEDEQQKNVNALLTMRQEIQTTALTGKDIAAVNTPDEQAFFLTQLRVNAASANIKLVQYTNMGMVLPPPSNDPNNPQQHSIYHPVASTLTVQGPYLGVRAFAYSLLHSNRLMNMNGVTWKRDSDTRTTTLSFTLIRYVKDPETQVTTKVAATSPAPSGGAIQ